MYKALTEIKEEHNLNFTIAKPTEKITFTQSIRNATRLASIRLSVYLSVVHCKQME